MRWTYISPAKNLAQANTLFSPFRVWLFLDEPTNVYTLIGGAILLLARAGSEPTEWNKAQASASYMRIQQQ